MFYDHFSARSLLAKLGRCIGIHVYSVGVLAYMCTMTYSSTSLFYLCMITYAGNYQIHFMEIIMNRDIQQTHQTRQADLYVPRYASIYAQRSPHYQMLTLWNKWASSCPELISKKRFKKLIKTTFLRKYEEYVHCDNARYIECNGDK